MLIPPTVTLLDEPFSGAGAVQELLVAEDLFFKDELALHHCLTPGEMLHQCPQLPPPPLPVDPEEYVSFGRKVNLKSPQNKPLLTFLPS